MANPTNIGPGSPPSPRYKAPAPKQPIHHLSTILESEDEDPLPPQFPAKPITPPPPTPSPIKNPAVQKPAPKDLDLRKFVITKGKKI